MTRRESREQAFILVFEKIFHPDLSFEEIVANANVSGSHLPDDFAVKLADTAYENIAEIDEVISGNTKNWRIERISKVALAILRLALCEIKFFDDIPCSVSINEAVELAKKYTSQEDASFINGLLGTFLRS